MIGRFCSDGSPAGDAAGCTAWRLAGAVKGGKTAAKLAVCGRSAGARSRGTPLWAIPDSPWTRPGEETSLRLRCAGSVWIVCCCKWKAEPLAHITVSKGSTRRSRDPPASSAHPSCDRCDSCTMTVATAARTSSADTCHGFMPAPRRGLPQPSRAGTARSLAL